MRTTPLPIVGVELGARMENTAISVTERVYLPTGERFTTSYRDHGHGRERLRAREKVALEYRVRHLERRSPPVLYKGGCRARGGAGRGARGVRGGYGPHPHGQAGSRPDNERRSRGYKGQLGEHQPMPHHRNGGVRRGLPQSGCGVARAPARPCILSTSPL